MQRRPLWRQASATGSMPATHRSTIQPGQERWFFEAYFDPQYVHRPGRGQAHLLFRTRHPGEPRMVAALHRAAAQAPARHGDRRSRRLRRSLRQRSAARRAALAERQAQWRPHRALPEARVDHALSRPDHRLCPSGRRLQPAGAGLRPPAFRRRHAGARAVLGAERLQVEFRARRAAQFRPLPSPTWTELPLMARRQPGANRNPRSTPIRPTSSSRKKRSPTTPLAPRAPPTCR